MIFSEIQFFRDKIFLANESKLERNACSVINPETSHFLNV